MTRAICILIAIAALISPNVAAADEPGMRPVRHVHYTRIRDHHIIEVAITPYAAREFIINGSHFAPKGDACRGWEAGQRITLVAGDWNGRCVSAVFRNLSLRRTCEMWCGYEAFHW